MRGLSRHREIKNYYIRILSKNVRTLSRIKPISYKFRSCLNHMTAFYDVTLLLESILSIKKPIPILLPSPPLHVFVKGAEWQNFNMRIINDERSSGYSTLYGCWATYCHRSLKKLWYLWTRYTPLLNLNFKVYPILIFETF